VTSTATRLLDAFRTGRSSPSVAIDDCLAMLDEREPRVHAFRTRCDAVARAAAAEADLRWRAGTARPLEGVPFAVKDTIDTAGVLTTAGSELHATRVPDHNATVVQRLLDAGAILIGKTATPEFAFGDAIDGHRAVNPWRADHWTGGSSSGSAVALASGEVPLAVGTDTGGSIRVPASYCGVTGLKPTFGLVPRDGVEPVSSTLDHVGPMARTIEDVALLLEVMTGGSFRREAPRPLRIGRPAEWFFDWGSPEVLQAAGDAIAALVKSGATVHEESVPSAHLAGMTAWTITVREFAALHAARPERLERMTPASIRRIEAGSALTAAEYEDAQATQAQLRHELVDAFTSVDALVTPATPTPAPRIAPPVDPLFDGGDEVWLERIARNFLIANVTGIPALVVPVTSHDGLPIGVQILAPPGSDQVCLQVGRALESADADLDVSSDRLFD
jgi:aspartyl-tRNA(Asn)/glutamyl-tRNA(Gln) amidotransferase subunit A